MSDCVMSYPNKYSHFTEAVDDIKNLKRSIDWHLWNQGVRDGIEEIILELEKILFWCIEQTEIESRTFSYGVGPYYYDELAKLYKSMQRTDLEIDILQRFSEQRHAPGVMPPKLLKRLAEIKAY